MLRRPLVDDLLPEVGREAFGLNCGSSTGQCSSVFARPTEVRHKIEAASKNITAVGAAKSGSTALRCGMAPKAAPIRRSWAADRQLQWRWCKAKRRNHISRQLAVRMRCVLAAVLAHSLDVGGRRR